MRQSQINTRQLYEKKYNYKYLTKSNAERYKTDYCFIIIYLIMSILILSVFFYSIISKKDIIAKKPVASNGVTCGLGVAQNYSYLYFPKPYYSIENIQSICVSKCPKGNQNNLTCLLTNIIAQCKNSQNFKIYQTTLNKQLSLCKPTNQIYYQNIMSKIFFGYNYNFLQLLFINRYIIILLSLLMNLLFITIYIIMVHCFNDLKFLYFGCIGIFIGCCLVPVGLFLFSSKLQSGWLVYIIFIIGFFTLIILIIIIFIIFNISSILQTIQLIGIVKNYLKQNYGLIISACITFLLWLLTCLVFLTIYNFILYICEKDYYFQQASNNLVFPYLRNQSYPKWVKITVTILVLHFIWSTICFYHSFYYLVLSTTSNWILKVPNYFRVSLYRLIKIHIGTILLGSILIPAMLWVSSLLYLLMPDKNGKLCCCNCSKFLEFYQIQRFRRYLGIYTRKLYICTNLYGENFYTAGYNITYILSKDQQPLNKLFRSSNFLSLILRLCFTVLTLIFSIIINKYLFKILLQFEICTIIIIVNFMFSSFITTVYSHTHEFVLLTLLLTKQHQNQIGKQSQHFEKLIQTFTTNPYNQVYNGINNWYQKQIKQQ